MMHFWSVCLLLVVVIVLPTAHSQYIVDDSKLGPVFDGIGGLSGGGATSRLLPGYSKEYLDKILDLLFKPNFAASLQILKVEIGGDGQSTDGTESSHMHSKDDENYQRGYEWLLLNEAKKRNPDIKLYALPWAFPAWVGNGTDSPYKFPNLTAGYIVKFIQGAKRVHDLTFDYVGIWNERPYDVTYIKTLRNALDAAGLQHVQIVAADGKFSDIAADVLKDSELSKAVSILGAHYPGTVSSDNAPQTGKKLWASEDYSTYNDDTGAGCWARILNQNFVNGNITSTISWNLIASYYEGLPFYRDGLMTAVEPWSGHFDINGPIYISAHTTQFTRPGDHYLPVGSGSGRLSKGGSYVSFIDSKTKELTIVVETMSHDHSICIRPNLPAFTVSRQTVTFKLQGSLARVTELHRWDSQLFDTSDGASGPQYFITNGTVAVKNGMVTIDLPIDHVMTLSTKQGQMKGSYDSPSSQPFPIPYKDDFESYADYSEAYNFADQSGVYEIASSNHFSAGQKSMKQVVPEHVLSWCGDPDQTLTLIGSQNWSTVSASVEVVLPGNQNSNIGAFIAGRISSGGCRASSDGVYFWIFTGGQWVITSDLKGTKVTSGTIDIKPMTPYTIAIDIEGTTVTGMVNGKVIASKVNVGDGSGFVGMGTSGYFAAEFNNFAITKAS